MKKQILFIKNVDREGPGILGILLESQNIKYETLLAVDTTQFPDPSKYKAIVILGGPDSANDNTLKILNEIAFVKKAFQLNIPMLGICLGLQIMVKAMGGNVVKSDVKEAGFTAPDNRPFTIEIHKKFHNDPLFDKLESPLNVFQLHGEKVQVTKSIDIIGTGRFCNEQIVKISAKSYGIQCHFELTEQMLELWSTEDPDLIPLGTVNLLEEFSLVKKEYTQTGKTLFQNFLNLI
ncbi:MAG: type 1 glutamine amidotransferase [Deltaproteobacteria bacterium]|nr:type 1 glutamine amidotransferase [Deltaproteobacteria bacterium]